MLGFLKVLTTIQISFEFDVIKDRSVDNAIFTCKLRGKFIRMFMYLFIHLIFIQ